MHYLYLTLAILFEIIGTTALRLSDGFTRLWPSFLVVLGYGASFYFLSFTLKEIPVGIAYAIWSGVGMSLITLIGWFYLKQKLDAPALIGIALIMVGVLIITLKSNSQAH